MRERLLFSIYYLLVRLIYMKKWDDKKILYIKKEIINMKVEVMKDQRF